MRNINPFNEFTMSTFECKTQRKHQHVISHQFLSRRDSHRDRAQPAESKLMSSSEISTPQLTRKMSSLQFKVKSCIKKDQLFTLLKGKNLSVSRSQSKQKKIPIEKNSITILSNEKEYGIKTKTNQTSFNNLKWRFNRHRQILRVNQQDNKNRKQKEKMFLNKKPLSIHLLDIQRSHFLRF